MIKVTYRSRRDLDDWQTVALAMNGLANVDCPVGFVREAALLGMWIARTAATAVDGPVTSLHPTRTTAAKWLLLVQGLAKEQAAA